MWIANHVLMTAIKANFEAVVTALHLTGALTRMTIDSAVVTKWLADHTIIGAIHAAFEALVTALHATGIAIRNALDVTQRLSAAKTAAANTYASVSAIPIVGPVLAPIAAGAAFAAVLAFQEGGIMPGHESLALLHPHEMVLPANISQNVQNMTSNSNKGGDRPELHYHGYQGQTKASMRKDAKEMQKHLEREARRGRLKLGNN